MVEEIDKKKSEIKLEKPERCLTCYFIECMLTPFMAKSCCGPFKDLKQRMKYYDAEIKDKEKKIT